MDNFLALLCFMGGPCDDDYLDIIGNLPPEIATTILRNLDPASLLSAALVNKRWLRLVKSDPVLRKRILSQLKKQKKMRSRALKFNCRVLRGNSSARPFEERNERFKVEMPVIAADALPPTARLSYVPLLTGTVSGDRSQPKSKPIGILPSLDDTADAGKSARILPDKPCSKKKSITKSFRQRLLRV